MARNGSGTYTIPNTFVAGTTITASDHNENWTDIGSEITNSLAADGQTPMTGQLKASSGSASAPGYAFSSDPDTGAYRRGSNEYGFSTAGVAAGYFDSAQKLWLLGALDVAGNASVTGTMTMTGLTTVGLLTSSSTSHMTLPNGTTAQRPASPAAAQLRYNSTLAVPEFYDGSSWGGLSAQQVAASFKNLLVTNNAVTPNSKIDLTCDSVSVETSAGVSFRLRSVSLTINCATTGANGLDAGGLANSTFYAAYVIYNPTTGTTAGLASLSATAPTLPSGYTAFARLGWFPTDGSANFYRIRQVGRRAYYKVTAGTNTAALPVIEGGVQGSVSGPTWVNFSLAVYVPTTAATYLGALRGYTLSGGVGTIRAMVAPSSDYGAFSSTSNPPLAMLTCGVNGNSQGAVISFDMPLETAQTVYYASDSTALSLHVRGWEDNI